MFEDKDPSFPFYAKDWTIETKRLSFDVKGLHADLRAEAWINGPYKNDSGYPSVLTAVEKKLFDGCRHLWILENELWFYGKDEEAREKRKKFRAEQKRKGDLSVQSRKNQQKQKRSVSTSDEFNGDSGINQKLTEVKPNKDNAIAIELGKGKEKVVKGGSGGKKKAPSVLFRDSPYAELPAFEMAFFGTDLADIADLGYYHESARNWSDSKAETKVDWIATVRNWMNKDKKEGKLKLKNLANGTHINLSAGSNGQQLGTSGERIAVARNW